MCFMSPIGTATKQPTPARSKPFANFSDKTWRLEMNQAKDSLSPSIDAFLAMATVEKGLAKNSVEAYARDLRKLSEFLISRGIHDWRDLNGLLIRSFVGSLRASGLNPRSVARHIVTLRQLLHFLATEGLIVEDPSPQFFLQPGSRKLPQTLSGADIRKLLSQPDSTKPLGARDRAMLEMLYATGVRVSELV